MKKVKKAAKDGLLIIPAVEPERRTYAKGFASSVFELCILNVLRAEDGHDALEACASNILSLLTTPVLENQGSKNVFRITMCKYHSRSDEATVISYKLHRTC